MHPTTTVAGNGLVFRVVKTSLYAAHYLVEIRTRIHTKRILRKSVERCSSGAQKLLNLLGSANRSITQSLACLATVCTAAAGGVPLLQVSKASLLCTALFGGDIQISHCVAANTRRHSILVYVREGCCTVYGTKLLEVRQV